MIEEKISQLNVLLQETDTSLIPILNSAIQLADLQDDKVFRLLFEYHLHGLDKGLGSMFKTTCPSGYTWFFLDRKMLSGPNSLTGSVFSLEASIRNNDQDIATALEEVKRVRSTQPMVTTIASSMSVGVANTTLARHRLARDQTQEVLSRIRLRVASYVREAENKIIRATSFPTNVTREDSDIEISDATNYDKKTGLLTHDVFEQDRDAYFREARQDELPLSLLMIDLDHFKKVNDTHGHPTGDEVLKAVAAIINKIVKVRGRAYRWGGEEISILLQNHSAIDAATLAERIRTAIAEAPISSKNLTVTASIGVAELSLSAVDTTELLNEADAAMYDAKKLGRNLVRISGQPPPSKDQPKSAIPPRKEPSTQGPFDEGAREAIRSNYLQSGIARCPFDSATLEVDVYRIDERRTADLQVTCPMCGVHDFLQGPA